MFYIFRSRNQNIEERYISIVSILRNNRFKLFKSYFFKVYEKIKDISLRRERRVYGCIFIFKDLIKFNSVLLIIQIV